ncbi:MAG: helix-turn-helix transcriptional regulator [Proteobacteria bacterium]|nr:helix-turn-helix transcriptional regulator [Pseudomonadota bacterium]
MTENTQPRRERAIPSGVMHLAIRVGGPALRLYADERDRRGREVARAVIGGAHGGYYLKRTAPGRTVGAQLKPGAAWALFGLSAAQLAQCHAPLRSFWGEAMDRLHERLGCATAPDDQLELLERAMLVQLRPIRALHPQVAHVLEALDVCANIDRALCETGCSHRHFIALFRDATGLTPKRYARIRRFRRALADAAGNDIAWSTLALTHGYCDQAHLSHDFREFTGLPPRAWRRAQARHPHHLPVR